MHLFSILLAIINILLQLVVITAGNGRFYWGDSSDDEPNEIWGKTSFSVVSWSKTACHFDVGRSIWWNLSC